jgi:hypothetical protein
MAGEPRQDETEAAADPDWFREPTPREHRIGAALFLGFGAFFALLAWVQRGTAFKWVTLVLAVFSTLRGIRHLLRTRHQKPQG